MNGAIALVTGADNPQGIGRAVCHALAARGAVVACSSSPDRPPARPTSTPCRSRPTWRTRRRPRPARRRRGVRRPPVDPRQQRRALHARRLRRPRRRDARRPLGRQRPGTRAAELRARPHPPARDAGPDREPDRASPSGRCRPSSPTRPGRARCRRSPPARGEVAPLGITVNAVGPGPKTPAGSTTPCAPSCCRRSPGSGGRIWARRRGGLRAAGAVAFPCAPREQGGPWGDPGPGRARRGRVPLPRG